MDESGGQPSSSTPVAQPQPPPQVLLDYNDRLLLLLGQEWPGETVPSKPDAPSGPLTDSHRRATSNPDHTSDLVFFPPSPDPGSLGSPVLSSISPPEGEGLSQAAPGIAFPLQPPDNELASIANLLALPTNLGANSVFTSQVECVQQSSSYFQNRSLGVLTTGSVAMPPDGKDHLDHLLRTLSFDSAELQQHELATNSPISFCLAPHLSPDRTAFDNAVVVTPCRIPSSLQSHPLQL
ncbi:hypothetical protein HK405_008505, partial [Cladochytrium tenue]